ncbi:type II toxin-antitoxin system HicA family toxin [Candidatus Falkowbacteria bacterium]|nr:type II toxin-antitoxin system HicA family toxin [Candidatus Falkowbacteria bacterium]
MDGKLPRLTASELIKVVEKADFRLVRKSGSHMIYKNVKGLRIVIPFHRGKILHSKIVKTAFKMIKRKE